MGHRGGFCHVYMCVCESDDGAPLLAPFFHTCSFHTPKQTNKQVCASSSSDPTTATGGAAGDEEAEEEEENEGAGPVLAQGIQYRYDRYEGNGKSPGPVRVVNADGSETPLAPSGGIDDDGSGAGGYVDVGGGGGSVEDLAAQLSTLQSLQM